jgi:sec-independent protein translocase protein TatA
MSLPPLLFAGVPGGLEMVVVLFVLFVLFGVPATLLVALGYKHVRDSARAPDDERLSELESEVEELRERLEAEDK